MGPMSRQMLVTLPQLTELLDALKSLGLLDIVWGVVGGYPFDWDTLSTEVRWGCV